MNYLLPERLDALARAYALGTLSRRATRRFTQTLASSAAAAEAVARWREILGTLELGAPTSLAPSEEVWDKVRGQLFERPAQPQARPSKPQRAGGAAGWLAERLPWPAALGVAAGLLLAGVFLQWRPQTLDMEPIASHAPASYVGVLLDDHGQALLSTIARRHGRVLTVRLQRPVPLAPGQALTIWAWNDSDPTPRRVGSWSRPDATDIALPAEAETLLGKMTHLGVSRELSAATPAAPALPMLAQGPCAKVW